MITLNDISDIMQELVDKGFTFMFSKSGLPGIYNIYFSYHNGKEYNSIHLKYQSEKNQVVKCADETHPIIVFNSKYDIISYVCNELQSNN